MTKYRNKYSIESARLKEWDYSTPWWYYITINAKEHICWFGEVRDTKMVFNELGKIVDKFWKEIPLHYSFIELDYYTIMPNHFHGIIILDNVETRHGVSLQQQENKFSVPVKNSLSMIINQFKGAVKRWCNKNGFRNLIGSHDFMIASSEMKKNCITSENTLSRIPLNGKWKKRFPKTLNFKG